MPFVRRLCLVAFPSLLAASRRSLLAASCFVLASVLSLSEIHYKPTAVYCQEKSPRNTTQLFVSVSGAKQSIINNSEKMGGGGGYSPLDPLPSASISLKLNFVKTFFSVFEIFIL